MVKEKTLISIVGPTAIGKTALSIGLANALNTEIVSCDSRQFYKEMNIGTAKPTDDELKQAKHHFINSHSIQDVFTSGDYERESIKLLDLLFKKYDTLILTGGSGLFEKAVIEGFDKWPGTSKALRISLNQRLEKEGLDSLLDELKEKDPDTFYKVERTNPRRVLRALEIVLSGGKPLSHWQSQKEERSFRTIRIGLQMDREKLYERINERVDKMIEEGLIEEAKSLLPFQHLNTLQTVGYTEIFSYLNGNISQEEAVELLKRNTRRYAKRQLTWFRKYADLRWFEAGELDGVILYIKEQLAH